MTSVDTPSDGDGAEASFRQEWQEVLAGQTRSASELREGIKPTPTPETRTGPDGFPNPPEPYKFRRS